MNVPIFLGAGASIPYGKPTTKIFKDALLQQMTQRDVLQAALSSPLHEDIEVVFTALEDMIALLQSDGGKFYTTYNKQLKVDANVIYNSYSFLTKKIYEFYAWDHDRDGELRNTLDPLVGMLEGLNQSINIFTTNYDRSVERYCEIADPQIDLVDGFLPFGGKYVWHGWSDQLGDTFSDDAQQAGIRSIRLYKLHGSLTWRHHFATGHIVKNESEEESKDKNYGNILIYPSKSAKISDNEPYKSTFNMFSSAMEHSDACIVVGFSFRDAYITGRFVELLEAGKLLIVVDPEGTNTIEKSMPEYMELVVVDTLGDPLGPILHNHDGSGRGRIVVIQESLDQATSQKIADRALEYIHLWSTEAGP